MRKMNRLAVLAAAALTGLCYELPAHGASMWIYCGEYSDSVLVLGEDMAQAKDNASIICPEGYRPHTQCSGTGWYAMIRAGTSGNVGYACGFSDRESALNAAMNECRSRGGSCDWGRSGFDPGAYHAATNATATMGGEDETAY